MDKPAHTPGPWWIQRAYHGAAGEVWAKRPTEPDLPQYQVNARHRGEGSSYCVATINYWESQEANASLIAAAPELLAALILVTQRCGPNSSDGAIARAAIAKALGQETTP